MWDGRKPDTWYWEGAELVTFTKKPKQKYWRDTSKVVDYPLSLCLERGIDC